MMRMMSQTPVFHHAISVVENHRANAMGKIVCALVVDAWRHIPARGESMPISNITGEKATPVLYLDIDGTVRHGVDELGRFVHSFKDVVIFEGVPDLLWGYKKLGWRIVGVSNQGGIALGLLATEDCLGAMAETQRQCNNAFDLISWCRHHPNADHPEMAICWCRKPKAGMVIEAAFNLADRHPGEIYPPHLGLFVGDRPEDRGCAEASGLTFMNAIEWRLGDHLNRIKT